MRELGLPADLFVDASEKLVESWRSRAARSYPSDLREVAAPVRLTLLASLCWMRSSEITDALVDLLIELILKVNTRADKRVERELIEDSRRVRGKERILFRLAEAAVEHPDDLVRTALFPVVDRRRGQRAPDRAVRRIVTTGPFMRTANPVELGHHQDIASRSPGRARLVPVSPWST